MIPADSPDLNSRLLLSLRNRHAGRRCFVIGNGPSLRPEDLDRIHAHGDLSLASNRIFLIFGRTAWRPTFGLLEDMAIARGSGHELDRYFPGNLVHADYLSELVAPAARHSSFRLVSRVQPPALPAFSDDFLAGVHGGATITYTMLQFAAWLGIREVYLLGVDFNYTVREQRPSTEFAGLQVYTSSGEKNHFAENYLKPGEVVLAPDMEAAHCAFQAARRHADQSDGAFQIFNATRGGKLEVFPRVDFDTLFSAPAAPADISPAAEALALARSTCLRESAARDRAVRLVELLSGTEADALAEHSLIDHFADAELVSLGPWAAANPGETTLKGRSSRTLLLHPHARLRHRLPHGAPGRLGFAVAMHPDVWNNPESGPCRFIVRVDGQVLFNAVLDVRESPELRQWHAFSLPVPASPEPHVVELETQGVDGDGFRWALWRDPVFVWTAPR